MSGPPAWKRRLKAAAIRAEIPIGVAVVVIYAAAVAGTVWLRPHISDGVLAFLILVSGFLTAIQATIASLKSDDTTD